MTALGRSEKPDIATTNRAMYRRRVRVYQSVILILALAYLVQAATPLRLHPDTVVLLSVADSVAHGGGFLFHGQPTVFPPGYPAFVALLLKLGLAHNWVLIGFNFVSLAVGFWAVGYILIRRVFDTMFPVLNVCLVSLPSFVFVKYSTIPLTEAGFFGLAMCCLAVLESASQSSLGRKFWLRIIAGWFLTAAALAWRRAGLALIPALLWSIFSHKEVREYVRRISSLMKIAILLSMGCASAVTVWIVMETSTLRDRQAVVTGQSLTDVISQNFIIRLMELGEMTLNVPFHTFPLRLRPAVLLVGGLILALILRGILMLRREIHPATVSLCSYSLMIFAWPWYDSRFWLPVVPLLMAYAGLSIKHAIVRHRSLAMFLRLYLTAFTFIGTMTLGWSTVITFSGNQFPNAYERPKPEATADLSVMDNRDAARYAEGLL